MSLSLRRKLHQVIQSAVRRLQTFVDRVWYAPLIGGLAGADNFVIVVPTDGILVSSTMLKPKRWLLLAACVTVGSTLGAVALAACVEILGLPWILQLYPGLEQTMTWNWTANFFDRYGLAVVFLVAVSPSFQQPAIVLAGLANTPLLTLAAVVFVGRLIKYLLMAYLASHAPHVLGRLWGLKGELEDAGVDLKSVSRSQAESKRSY
jgi:membrane protein YqaA with SNARE-associated domain